MSNLQPSSYRSPLERSIEEFAARHGLADEWRRWRAEHPVEPPGAGIDFAADMRDRRKGERRQGGDRRSSAR